MANVTSASSSSSMYSQLQVQQAKQAADRAEATARNLQAKADAAQNRAAQEQETARNLNVQSDQAEQKAGSLRQGLSSLQSVRQIQSGLNNIHEQIKEITTSAPIVTPTKTVAPAVVNSQGQTTGTVVNTTA